MLVVLILMFVVVVVWCCVVLLFVAMFLWRLLLVITAPGRREGCSTWSRGGCRGSAGRSRRSGAPPWRGSRASATPGPATDGGSRTGSTSSTGDYSF